MGIAAASMPLQFSGKRARAVFEEDAPVAYLVELDRSLDAADERKRRGERVAAGESERSREDEVRHGRYPLKGLGCNPRSLERAGPL